MQLDTLYYIRYKHHIMYLIEILYWKSKHKLVTKQLCKRQKMPNYPPGILGAPTTVFRKPNAQEENRGYAGQLHVERI
jgi:hypothetical protein